MGDWDDDGVIFLSGLQPGQTAQIAVVASQLSVSPGYLQGWLDFNSDGDWDDAGEQIFTNQRLATGSNVLSAFVPADAAEGNTAARFRWGLERGLSYDGPAMAGEVEDYAVTIPMDPDQGIRAMADAASVAEDSTNNPLDVLLNDVSRLGLPLTIASVTATDQGGTVQIVGGTSLSYTPAPNFFGQETFRYTAEDETGAQATATVTVTVTPVNDNPNALDDELTVGQSTVENVLNVLANDSIAPDTGENLTIVAVSAPRWWAPR